MNQVFYLGTCRVYNALELINYPRCELGFGFLHSVEQIYQALRIVSGDLNVPQGRIKYLFRNNFTPTNEQLTKPELLSLANTPDSNEELVDLHLPDFHGYDIFVLEISTLGECQKDGYFYHRNPNLYLDVPWGDIKSCGFYEQYAPHLGVDFHKDSYESFSVAIKNIVDLCAPRPVIFVSHLINKKWAQEMPWLQVRVTISEWLDKACLQHEKAYPFHPTQVIDKYGFKGKDGKIDNAHLTDEGTMYYAKLLKEKIDSIID